MIVVLLSLIGVLLIGLLIIVLKSPGKLPSLKDAQGNVIQGSISEKVWLDVGGIKQGMFIRGENIKNPIILYVHGRCCNLFLIWKKSEKWIQMNALRNILQFAIGSNEAQG